MICYEASKINFNKLTKSKKYEKSNIILNNIALGSEESELEFFQTSDSSSSTFCKIDHDSNYFKRKKRILNFFQKDEYIASSELIKLKTLKNEFINDKYPILLQKYASAIAATSDTPSIKYWEIPAAGCLTFMEITDENRGKYLGFIDGETAIFIDQKNYKEKFQEFLDDPNNPKWGKIANSGRNFVLKKFNNDKAVESLVKIMKKLI